MAYSLECPRCEEALHTLATYALSRARTRFHRSPGRLPLGLQEGFTQKCVARGKISVMP